jgi:hypothetical protein
MSNPGRFSKVPKFGDLTNDPASHAIWRQNVFGAAKTVGVAHMFSLEPEDYPDLTTKEKKLYAWAGMIVKAHLDAAMQTEVYNYILEMQPTFENEWECPPPNPKALMDRIANKFNPGTITAETTMREQLQNVQREFGEGVEQLCSRMEAHMRSINALVAKQWLPTAPKEKSETKIFHAIGEIREKGSSSDATNIQSGSKAVKKEREEEDPLTTPSSSSASSSSGERTDPKEKAGLWEVKLDIVEVLHEELTKSSQRRKLLAALEKIGLVPAGHVTHHHLLHLLMQDLKKNEPLVHSALTTKENLTYPVAKKYAIENCHVLDEVNPLSDQPPRERRDRRRGDRGRGRGRGGIPFDGRRGEREKRDYPASQGHYPHRGGGPSSGQSGGPSGAPSEGHKGKEREKKDFSASQTRYPYQHGGTPGGYNKANNNKKRDENKEKKEFSAHLSAPILEEKELSAHLSVDECNGVGSQTLDVMVDSGCTTHIIGRRHASFIVKKEACAQRAVGLADGTERVTTCKVNVRFPLANGTHLCVEDALFVKEFESSYLSVGQWTRKPGIKLKFQGDLMIISERDEATGMKRTICTSRRRGNLYYLGVQMGGEELGANLVTELDLAFDLHCRMGHPHLSVLRKALRDGSITGLPKDILAKNLRSCDVCIQGKTKRKKKGGSRPPAGRRMTPANKTPSIYYLAETRISIHRNIKNNH